MGRHPRYGIKLVELADEKQIFSILEKTLEYYRREGLDGERLGELFDRLGIEKNTWMRSAVCCVVEIYRVIREVKNIILRKGRTGNARRWDSWGCIELAGCSELLAEYIEDFKKEHNI